jgi:putative membrane-bound dehydrogenase-like protein
MMRRIHLAFLLAQVPTLGLAGESPAPLRVLFLGDQGRHCPSDRAAQITPVLAGRGIDVTYTERADELNADNLAKYDALLIYANIEQIAPEQETALLDYVNGGGGFVPLHCASYCFLNSAKYVELVGAQFDRHGTGEFDTRLVDGEHPINRGLIPFHTWDETYVHRRHRTEGRHVLQTRDENGREEPWTWVRSLGKGRVFYTAYGHDARTWQNPGFHDLLERGIRWASGKGDVFDSRPRVPAGLKAFESTPAKIPLYLPDAKWGTQGEPIKTMQKPVSPEESMPHMVVPGGFEVSLFAAEPQIAKPLCMAWDHRGRLWIAESVDYPNEKQPPGKGRDRIKICEDTDRDGKADRFTVFAEDLSIPTSIVFANGGLVVASAPDFLFLKDADGDDVADERRVLFTGWDTRDTHAGPSNLRYGFDNWIWGIDGYSGFRGTVGGERVEFRQGFFRMRPDGSKLEYIRSTNNNSWGVGFSEDGLVFGSTANGCPSVYMPIANRYYESVRGWSPTVLGNIAANNQFFPITDKVRQVDWHGGFTAGAGHALYTARAYPKHYWNSTAFVAEPTGHLVATFTLQRNGSDVRDYYGWNLVASDDEWTSPIAAEVGPDGNVWIIDWYNFIVQHNPTPEGFKTGKGNAYETPLRDKTHGRIYRIVYKDAKLSPMPKLDPDDGPGLVAALKNDNMLWRLHAQRLLVERGKADVLPALIALVQDRSVDAIGLNPGAIHALATLPALGAFSGDTEETRVALAALRHPSPGVRRMAASVLPHTPLSAESLAASGALRDPDAQVRLAALLELSEGLPSPFIGSDLAKLLAESPPTDRWLADALTSAAAKHDAGFLKALAARRFDKAPADPSLAIVRRVAEHHARGGPSETIGSLAVALAGADPKVAESILAGLSKGWPKEKPAKLDDAAEEALGRFMARLSPESQGQLIGLAQRWGSRGFEKYAAEIADTLLATARDEAKRDAERIAAARQLVALKADDPSLVGELLQLITPRSAPELSAGLIDAAGKSESHEAGATLIEGLPPLTPAARAQAIRALLSRADWTPALMDAIDAGQIRLAELSLDQKQALAAHPDKALANRAKKLMEQGGGLPDADRQKVIDTIGPVVLEGGDAARGKKIFADQCAKCHTHSGEGGKVGPDLTGMAAHPRSELLIHILDPSRSVEGNFVQYNVATTDGRVLNGLLAAESKNAIELIDAEGKKQDVLREDIDQLIASSKSLMPEGFEKQVPPEGIADLLAFLTQRGRWLPLDLRKVATIVSTRGMFYDKDAEAERLIFPDWSPKEFAGVPFLLVDPQGDRVPNVVLLSGPQGVFPPRMPKAVSLPCHSPARAIHLLSGVSGWGAQGGGGEPTVSMIVRLKYADGTTEDHELENGVHFADYIRPFDVPGSKLAFRLRGQQIRYLAIEPKKDAVIDEIELVKGPDATAPVVMAVTVETR